ncbi:hypothetical protein BD626DRAFT_547553 [Schizophyllum amplum]|uniref:NADAR domain-containing protein n=1 Tax=Schizophyllum amplum TaxID=97359 RepID=A0A550CI19_9AGAR|nr:hypothetical protein BD626DRAFT_547553 [Auriculariopsis ampla]
MAQRTYPNITTNIPQPYRTADTFLATSTRGPSPSSQSQFPGPRDESPRPAPRTARPRQRIGFYDRNQPHYGFTNFSSHQVEYKGKIYPTSEHLFQAFKFMDTHPELVEHIRTCSPRPRDALSEARRLKPQQRPDWFKVNIDMMDEAIYHKFTQHKELRDELLATGNAELVEDSPVDAFWGIGKDGRGRNELGKALGRLRDRLRRRTTLD